MHFWRFKELVWMNDLEAMKQDFKKILTKNEKEKQKGDEKMNEEIKETKQTEELERRDMMEVENNV